MEKFKTVIFIRLLLEDEVVFFLKKTFTLPFNPLFVSNDCRIIAHSFCYNSESPHDFSMVFARFEQKAYNPYTDTYQIVGTTFFENKKLIDVHANELMKLGWREEFGEYVDDFHNFKVKN